MFTQTLGIFGIMIAITAVVYRWRTVMLRQTVLNRLFDTREESRRASDSTKREMVSGPLRRTWLLLPWGMGAMLTAALVILFQWSLLFASSVGLIVGMLGAQLESYLAGRRAAKIEAQLADAIDLMVGALGAGTGVMQAMQAAISETSSPLRGQLEEVVGRIRFGDDPQAVFRSLSDRVPLETFLLFASAMAVNWEVGGSLSPTLATVGRTIRDRIEIGRRIQSNIAQSQLSTYFLLGLTYFIAAIVWRNNPDNMRQFLATGVGQMFVAGSMVMQAAGMVWMAAISRVRF